MLGGIHSDTIAHSQRPDPSTLCVSFATCNTVAYVISEHPSLHPHIPNCVCDHVTIYYKMRVCPVVS